MTLFLLHTPHFQDLSHLAHKLGGAGEEAEADILGAVPDSSEKQLRKHLPLPTSENP